MSQSSPDRRFVAVGLAVLALLGSGCAAAGPETAGTEPAGPAPAEERSTAGAVEHSSGHANPEPAETPRAMPQRQVLAVQVTDGRVADRTGSSKVPLGEKVRLRVECDTADEVHVHGYDASAPCAPGKAATITFTADIPGVFEVELEDSGLALLDLTVR